MKYDCRILRPDGKVKFINLRFVPVFDDEGKLLRSYGTILDITVQKRAEEAIKESEDKFRYVFDNSVVGKSLTLPNNEINIMNKSLCQMLGYTMEELQGKKWSEISHPDDVAASQREVDSLLSGEIKSINIFKRYIKKDGSVLWADVHASLRKDSDGTPMYLMTTVIDITEKKRAMEALHESERSKAVLLSHLPGLAFRCNFDESRTMRYLSEGCRTLTGYSPEALIDNHTLSFNDIICPQYRNALREENARALHGHVSFRYEYEIMTAAGEKKWVLEMSQGLYDDQGGVEAVEGIIIDITQSKQRYEKIQYMNDHDDLTDLYNRRYFENAKMELDTQENMPLAILVADINGIRLINDAFGHALGDRIIRKTGEIIKSCCRMGDILARTGGDEFSLLLPRTDQEGTTRLLDLIQNAFKKYNSSADDKSVFISLSMGYAVKPALGTLLNETEKEAEVRLSQRKLLEQKSHHNAILSSILATMYERSNETEEHTRRIAQLLNLLGTKMQLPQSKLDELQLFSALHDIGKVGISDQILKKPGSLTQDEWVEMKKHPEIGYRIAMSSADFSTVADCVLTHHEHWDGSGYPSGMSGEDIPLLSRLLAVVDAYDALTKDRVYRKAISHEEAMAEIIKNAGTQFDPKIVKAFEEIMSDSQAAIRT